MPVTTDLQLKDAFDLYEKNRDQVLKMWNFFSVVTLGLVVWALGALSGPSPDSRIWVVLGYTVFTVGNAVAVISAQRELARIAKGLADLSKGLPLSSLFKPSPLHPMVFLVFYVVIGGLVDAAIIWRR